jgi:hypothetical protein
MFKTNQTKERNMTKFNTKLQYVSWNDSVKGSAKAADTKKTKLENQGYILVSTQAGLFSGLMVYKNTNYKKGQ